MDVRDAEVKVGGIAENETAGEEEADGEDGTDEKVAGDVDILDAVKEVGSALEDTGTDRLEARGSQSERGQERDMRLERIRRK